jgi:hypothetical protein
MKKIDFEANDDGTVVVKPITGWTSAVFAEFGILIAIRYAEDQQALQRGEDKQIQFAWTPQLALDFAEELTKQAKSAIYQTSQKPLN